MDVGEMLFRSLRVDYTYLHPEVLAGRCLVRNNRLILDNKENCEEFRVLILPGGSTLSYLVAEKTAEFYEHGGTVIATSRLPYYSAEPGRESDLRARISGIFGVPIETIVGGNVPVDPSGYLLRRNAAGGRAYFLPKPNVQLLKAVLHAAVPGAGCRFQRTGVAAGNGPGVRWSFDLHPQS